MATGDFFAALWGVIGVLVLLLLAAVLVGAGVAFVKHQRSKRQAAIILGEDAATRVQGRFEFTGFRLIPGTRYALSPFEPITEGRNAFFGVSACARNYLIVNLDDRSSRFLLPTHSQMVVTLDMLGTTEEPSRDAPLSIRWLYCHIVDTDTDGDGRLTEDDAFSIAFADADGANLTPLVIGVTRFLGRLRLSADSMLLFYGIGGKSLVSEVNIPERRVVSTQELPVLPQVAGYA